MRGKMTWFGIAMSLALVLGLSLPMVVLADGGPHQGSGFGTTPDGCAGCHRAHTAVQGKLLNAGEDLTEFCNSCHNGVGADTNTVEGRLMSVRHDTPGIPASGGTPGSGLRGGGFYWAYMITDIDPIVGPAPVPVTSKHNTTASGTVWGSNVSTGPGDTRVLECTSCHNPHGNGKYRMLRSNPGATFDTALSNSHPAVDVPDDPLGYVINYDADGYRIIWDEVPGTGWEKNLNNYNYETLLKLGEWCSICHAMYEADAVAGHEPSGHDTFAYRHWTVGAPGLSDGGSPTSTCWKCHDEEWVVEDPGESPPSTAYHPDGNGSGYGYGDDGDCLVCHGPTAEEPAHLDTCFACHVAHGTSAAMGPYSGNVPWPDQVLTVPLPDADPSGNARSSLLWLDNRGVCRQCHDSDILGN